MTLEKSMKKFQIRRQKRTIRSQRRESASAIATKQKFMSYSRVGDETKRVDEQCRERIQRGGGKKRTNKKKAPSSLYKGPARYAKSPFLQGYQPTDGTLPHDAADFLGDPKMWKFLDNETCSMSSEPEEAWQHIIELRMLCFWAP
jgi:hypothetical protein